jgi:hypothetical protein
MSESEAKGPSNPDPAMPRVMCPGCGAWMRLARIDPTDGRPRTDRTVFDCECGTVYEHTVVRR